MSLKTLRRLCIWEFEAYWGFPFLEIVLSIAIISGLSYYSGFVNVESKCREFGWALYQTYTQLIMIFAVGVSYSRSFADSINSKVMTVLLSYPLRRWEVFLSKFTTNLLSVYVIFGSNVIFNALLFDMNLLDSALYISLLILFVRSIFLCTVAMTVALVARQEAISILGSVLLLYGLEFATAILEPPYPYLSMARGGALMFDYLIGSLCLGASNVAFQDFLLAFLFPVVVSSILLSAGLIYFQHMMQLD